MNRLRAYYQLSLADFRERTRRSSFLVTMLGILFLGYLVITGKYSVQFGDFRPIYDSAWSGTLMAVCSSIMLTIFGFYIIKGSIKRDRKTEVGQIIATTPMSNFSYIAYKFISNLTLLLAMIAVLALIAFVALLVRNESGSIDIISFILPFVVFSLPAMVFVAGMTVLFESVKWLRGSFGNIVYLFMAEFCLVMGVINGQFLDIAGMSLFTESVKAAASAAYPGEKIPLIVGFVMFDPSLQVDVFKPFTWPGIDWGAIRLSLRFYWIMAAFIAIGLSIPFFDRFDPARKKLITRNKKKKSDTNKAVYESSPIHANISYGEINSPPLSFSWVSMVLAEMRLALKGYHWVWYAIFAGLMVSQLVVPFEIARKFILPASMVWPLVIWSSMGTREFRFGTDLLLNSSSYPLRRQFPSVWLSGVAIAILAVFIMLFRAAALAEWSYVAALLVGAVFVPSMAFALGTLSRSKRFFEVLYLMVWYTGSIEHIPGIDILGTSASAISMSKSIILVGFAMLSVATAFVTRKIRIERN